MSNSHLIEWFDQLLFGQSDAGPSDACAPPFELKDLILRLESEHIPWSHVMRSGGLAEFPYLVHGDLNYLIDYLEKQWMDKEPFFEPPALKTRAVSKFWNQFQVLLARRLEPTQETLPVPSKRDDEILKEILEPNQFITSYTQFEYESPKFWGQVARKFIHLNRPEESSSLPKVSSYELNRAMQLYDITRYARGKSFDPLTMHLVPHSEYLSAVFWQTGQNLEAFIRDQPTHALSLSVQSILKRNLNHLLQGKKPCTLYEFCPQLDALLYNINKIHESIEQVPNENAPPKLIDVFQRLLALYHRDELWEKTIPKIEPEPISPSLLYLTERVRILEREKRILLNHFIEKSSLSKHPSLQCPKYSYGKI